jgi:hypothetical protein
MPTSHLGSRCMSKHITQSKSRLFFGSLADKTTRSCHVRFTPDCGHSSVQVGCPKSANSGHANADGVNMPMADEYPGQWMHAKPRTDQSCAVARACWMIC